MAKNKWSKFIPQQTTEQQNEDGKNQQKKNLRFSDSQIFQISTHDSSFKDSIDIEISDDLVSQYPVYLEISVKDQPIKFIIQVQEINVTKTSQKISILKNITDLYKIDYDINMRFQAYIRVVNEQEKTYQLSFVEILIKEHFLSRRDMQQINNKLQKQTCYTKKLIPIGRTNDNIKATVQISQLMMRDTNNQEYAYTGIITEETNIVYRSLEAKMSILIEISQETFQADAIGETALESIQKFLKVFYLRNQLLMTNHKLEIVLFTRIYFSQYETIEQFYQDCSKQTNLEDTWPLNAQLDQFGKVFVDVYKKVPERKSLRNFDQLSQVCINSIQELAAWINVREVSNYHKFLVSDYMIKKPDYKQIKKPKGKISSSKKCNLLEAVTLVTQSFREDHLTRSLKNSGHLILILSSGNGYYFGDFHNYKIAKRNALNHNIVCMLNCFGRIPNITHPMFYLSEQDLPLENNIPKISEIAQKYFNDSLTYLKKLGKPSYFYQDRNKQGKVLNEQLRHAYWISIVKYNDEFLRSFFHMYERQNQNDLLSFCLKKKNIISYSQVDFTLTDYYQPKQAEFIQEQSFDTILMQSLNDPEFTEKQLRKNQCGTIEEEVKKQIPIDTSSQPNIFFIPCFIKQPDETQQQQQQQQQQQSQTQTQTQAQIQTSTKTIKSSKGKKLKSHNRIKWRFFQWGWKCHYFIFQMKEAYHKHFKVFLQNNLKEPEFTYFVYELYWKNICFVPLFPLKTAMVYEERQELKTSGVLRCIENGNMSEFEKQVMGILLADNYQWISSNENIEDQYGQKVQFQKNNNNSPPVKFIKGGHIVILNYDRIGKKNYGCEDYYKNKQKAQTKKQRYIQISVDQAIIIPKLYRYNLHQKNGITSREILLIESLDTDVKALTALFSDGTDYTEKEITQLRPKRIGLAYLPNECLNETDHQIQYSQWIENFNNFQSKLKQQIKCFNSDNVKCQYILKCKQMDINIYNQYNYLKYDLQEKQQLHDKYEQICISNQINYCPKCAYIINLSWISSQAISISKIIKILEMCAVGFLQIQIPGIFAQIFDQDLPFHSILKIKVKNIEILKQVNKQIRYPPFDCFYGIGKKIMIHKKGLFFLKFDYESLQILFKENQLYSEDQVNSDLVQQLFQKLQIIVQQ